MGFYESWSGLFNKKLKGGAMSIPNAGLFLIFAASLLAGQSAMSQAVSEKSVAEKPVFPVAETRTGEEASIQWFATLDRGLAEAKRTGKPILFVSAAPHCAGVSGMW